MAVKVEVKGMDGNVIGEDVVVKVEVKEEEVTDEVDTKGEGEEEKEAVAKEAEEVKEGGVIVSIPPLP